MAHSGYCSAVLFISILCRFRSAIARWCNGSLCGKFTGTVVALWCNIQFFYIRPLQLHGGNKQFWLWAVLWWLLLFGRSTSWGRDYFPEVPKPYFRAISVMLIAPVVFMLFSPYLRKEIAKKLKYFTLPIWALMLAFSGLIISDAIEHERAIDALFLRDIQYKDLMEELYEFPLILGLLFITYHLMKQDKPA